MRSVGRWAILIVLGPVLFIAGYFVWQFRVYVNGEGLLRSALISFDELGLHEGEDFTVSPVQWDKAEVIPRTIHQVYKTTTIPEAWREAQQSCQDLHQDWEYRLWTDEAAREFLELEYAWFLPTYYAYPYEIQRVDAIRYFILLHHGGFYLDLDVGCKNALTPLLHFDAVLPKTSPIGVSNDMMAARKGHPLFDDVVRKLPSNAFRRGTKYPTVFLTTGPMFLSTRVFHYLRWLRSPAGDAIQSVTKTNSIRILPQELYGSAPHSFFRHYAGSSWHGSDASMIKYVVRHKYWTTALVVSAVGALLILAIVRCRTPGVKKSKAEPKDDFVLQPLQSSSHHRAGD